MRLVAYWLMICWISAPKGGGGTHCSCHVDYRSVFYWSFEGEGNSFFLSHKQIGTMFYDLWVTSKTLDQTHFNQNVACEPLVNCFFVRWLHNAWRNVMHCWQCFKEFWSLNISVCKGVIAWVIFMYGNTSELVSALFAGSSSYPNAKRRQMFLSQICSSQGMQLAILLSCSLVQDHTPPHVANQLMAIWQIKKKKGFNVCVTTLGFCDCPHVSKLPKYRCIFLCHVYSSITIAYLTDEQIILQVLSFA